MCVWCSVVVCVNCELLKQTNNIWRTSHSGSWSHVGNRKARADIHFQWCCSFSHYRPCSRLRIKSIPASSTPLVGLRTRNGRLLKALWICPLWCFRISKHWLRHLCTSAEKWVASFQSNMKQPGLVGLTARKKAVHRKWPLFHWG